jgi:urease accessory protein
LAFERRHGRTVLANAYAEPPFRVGACFQEGDGLHLILASSAPGIFSGDSFEQSVDVGPGALVRLTSQSALQVHASAEADAARVTSIYKVAEGGDLRCHWDPLIPFPGARLEQKIEVHLSGGARLCWSDALMAGREARGERWRFHSIAHELRVVRSGRLEYLERYRIAPHEMSPQPQWIAGDACYFGTTILSGWELDRDAVDRLHQDLASTSSMRGAADALDGDVVLARLLGSSGVSFHEARRRFLRVVGASHERA